jgi:hypothetical protein
VAVAPAGPSAAQVAARRRAAAARARQARIKAERLRAARAAAQQKKAEARKLAADRAASRADREDAAVGSAESATTDALPILLVGLFAAVLLLGLAMTPAWAVPWPRAARVLEDRREEVAVLAAMGLLATGLFFLFLTVVAR